MVRVRRCEEGFTLIETILVLSIVMVITSSIIFVFSGKMEEKEERRFFRQFHLDMQKMQAIAIGETKYTSIKFAENGTKYRGQSETAILFEHELPDRIRLSSDSKLKEIIFHPNGMVRQFGTLVFETKTGLKNVTIHIGNGRLNYEE
ncbi:competence type IV pilus minor pilin ComGD [Bacillus sp. FJAT-22090]|uniref:competence type IV pilus minor pilin ComGD n=1 Tax=Bacillus sp. FJAT-22090 TaxID=1581038 RepID=UPI0011A1B8CC|nr:competence type IV pilus minor pilin ComGD [Bacillus sp. FJAT-22090]